MKTHPRIVTYFVKWITMSIHVTIDINLIKGNASMYYQKHLFFCINQKANGKTCCQDHRASEFREYAAKQLKAMNLLGEGKVRVNKSGCLGRCELGPIIVIYPEGVWYTYETTQDIDEIIEKHVLNGQTVQRLLIDPLD